MEYSEHIGIWELVRGTRRARHAVHLEDYESVTLAVNIVTHIPGSNIFTGLKRSGRLKKRDLRQP
ncbi:unnamed protein product [Arctogadus glacialis]